MEIATLPDSVWSCVFENVWRDDIVFFTVVMTRICRSWHAIIHTDPRMKKLYNFKRDVILEVINSAASRGHGESCVAGSAALYAYLLNKGRTPRWIPGDVDVFTTDVFTNSFATWISQRRLEDRIILKAEDDLTTYMKTAKLGYVQVNSHENNITFTIKTSIMKVRIQFVRANYRESRTVQEVIDNFDLDICKVALTDRDAFEYGDTWSEEKARGHEPGGLNVNVTVIDMDDNHHHVCGLDRCDCSGRMEIRKKKYESRGYEIYEYKGKARNLRYIIDLD